MAVKLILIILAYMLLLVLSTFFIVPYLAYGMEIDPTYDGRTSVSAWRMLFPLPLGWWGRPSPP